MRYTESYNRERTWLLEQLAERNIALPDDVVNILVARLATNLFPQNVTTVQDAMRTHLTSGCACTHAKDWLAQLDSPR